jgi:hypothetical protein
LKRVLFALVAGLACARRDEPASVDTASAVVVTAETSAALSPGGNASCPATGLWSVCAVTERIERAGLAPRVDSLGATEPPLTPRGTLLKIGRSELELYVYTDVAAREREQRTLDREKYLAAESPVGIKSQPTLIHSANLIAILHSRNDHQRERVSDAISAGPPQPAKP